MTTGIVPHSRDVALDLLRKELGATRYPLIVKAVVRLFRGNHDGSQALVHIRLGQYWQARGNRKLARMVQDRLRKKFACYVSFNAQIGRRLKLPHPVGIVIGDTTRIDDDCTIFQHVTLGGVGPEDVGARKYPLLCDGVTVYTGAIILGGVEIGSRSIIAAGSVVRSHIPPGVMAAGVPAEVKR